jgi:hypothetical protein
MQLTPSKPILAVLALAQHQSRKPAETDHCLLITAYCPFPPPEPEIRRNPLPPGPHFPTFNSNADHNVPFREASGEASQAQFHAFTDAWTWADAAELVNQSATIDANSKRPSETEAAFSCWPNSRIPRNITVCGEHLRNAQ